jgi:hypothetical protein
LLLVLLGFALIFSPHVLIHNVHFGIAPTWGHFLLAVPVAMIAYTGIETVSNLAEEARDPVKNIPRSIRLVAIAVFVIYFTLPWIALSALPVTQNPDGSYQTLLGVGPPEGFSNDPVLGLVENLGLHGAVLSAMKIYVGILAATILFIATNAGVIGASRITYAMASHRQLPEVFRRLHSKFKTPYISLLFFAGVIPMIVLLPGKTAFLGTMYSFGAMLSFTIAHASIIALRRKPAEAGEFRARPNLRNGGLNIHLYAGIRPGPASRAGGGRAGGGDALAGSRLAPGSSPSTGGGCVPRRDGAGARSAPGGARVSQRSRRSCTGGVEEAVYRPAASLPSGATIAAGRCSVPLETARRSAARGGGLRLTICSTTARSGCLRRRRRPSRPRAPRAVRSSTRPT